MNKWKTWVLLANQGRAIIFSLDGDAYKIVKKFECPEAMKKESDIFTSRSGTAVTSFTNDQVSVTESHYMEEVNHRFAHEIVDYLEKNRHLGAFTNLNIVSAKNFAGELRHRLSTCLQQMIGDEILKNFYTEKPYQLMNFLSEHQSKPADKVIA